MSRTYHSKLKNKMCTTKNKYRNKENAEKAAWFLTQKYGVQQRAYYCPICGCYHLSTKMYD